MALGVEANQYMNTVHSIMIYLQQGSMTASVKDSKLLVKYFFYKLYIINQETLIHSAAVTLRT